MNTMAGKRNGGAGAGSTGVSRLLVIATERCIGPELLDEIRARMGTGGAARIVAPALETRLQYWASDDDPGRREAARLLEESVQACRAAGITVEGAVGDADPLQAIDDEMRTFSPTEILLVTHPADRGNWLERDLAPQARERYDIPVGHVVVDVAAGRSQAVPPAAEPQVHRREGHHTRDVVILVVITVLAVVGTLVSLLLYSVEASTVLLAAWVLVMDLGVKLLLIVLLWAFFLRRARADRLDF